MNKLYRYVTTQQALNTWPNIIHARSYFTNQAPNTNSKRVLNRYIICLPYVLSWALKDLISILHFSFYTLFHYRQYIGESREYELSTYISFIDFQKAFNRVNKDRLWVIMAVRGIPHHLIRAIQRLYVGNKILVETVKSSTTPGVGVINCGVRQECPLSPTLFNSYGRCRTKLTELVTLRLTRCYLLMIRLSCKLGKQFADRCAIVT